MVFVLLLLFLFVAGYSHLRSEYLSSQTRKKKKKPAELWFDDDSYLGLMSSDLRVAYLLCYCCCRCHCLYLHLSMKTRMMLTWATLYLTFAAAVAAWAVFWSFLVGALIC